jgi:LysM repeat protein
MRRLSALVLLVACSLAGGLAHAKPKAQKARSETHAAAKTKAKARVASPAKAKKRVARREKPQPRSTRRAKTVARRSTETRQSLPQQLTRVDRLCKAEERARGVTLRTHRIARGDSLSVIAVRYGTSVRALAAANGIERDQIIKTGQTLVIPQHSRPGGGDDWLKYARKPKEAGRLDLLAHKSRFRGAVLEKGRVLPSARHGISSLLGAGGSHPAVPERLIKLLVQVSDTFGGRQLRVVSGYRQSSFFEDSRHKASSAVDFSIPGIPNEVVRQYLLLLEDAGVGYYPNSSFLHLDVRGCAVQWVDYAGPGEAPRKTPNAPRRYAKISPKASDLDDIAEEVVAAMEQAATASDPSAEEPAPAAPDAGPSDLEGIAVPAGTGSIPAIPGAEVAARTPAPKR